MTDQKPGSKSQPFPRFRPTITITPSRAKPFAVDSRELFFVKLELGASALWATYDPPEWKLTNVSNMRVVRPCVIHGIEGVEIEQDDWEPDTGWQVETFRMYARLTETTTQWLATLHIREGKQVLYTFLDEGFDADWGEQPRRLEDRKHLVLKKDGTYRLRRSKRGPGHAVIAAGVFRVRIGERAFTCLRVFDLGTEGKGISENIILSESYLTRRGRTVLFRRYNGRQWELGWGQWSSDQSWDERFPDNDRIVIDGSVFVHWYDCLSNLACGIT